MMNEVEFSESSFLEYTFYGTVQFSKRQNVTMKIAKILARRKTEEEEGNDGGTKLKRVLGLADLTMLGVGSTLGLGVYVLAGAVAKTDAGPAVTISFLIAAVASAFAGLCYAEFAARVPKAGSAYIYSYVTVGELAAFIIGWNLILEYVIGTASVARGLSNYIDSLSGKVMSTSLTEALPIGVSWLSPYPDFLSCGFILVLALLLAWGVKESSFLNNVFTVVNLCTVTLVIVVGAFYINIQNWALDPASIPEKASGDKDIKVGAGGFMPFGVSGIMAGAAKCFYGFVGFDCVATTGEEAKKPQTRHSSIYYLLSNHNFPGVLWHRQCDDSYVALLPTGRSCSYSLRVWTSWTAYSQMDCFYWSNICSVYKPTGSHVPSTSSTLRDGARRNPV
uniref:Cationic amino acid transporter C-terminal domain-containing protein n=1 Tax=Graphocephala atropunctata TaxID=36148 RepID=A0A1B6KPK8_9HEMI